MDNVQIKLSALWVALMLTYLLGDVLRIFSGDIKPGEIAGQPATQGMWMLIASIMVTPIIMVVLTLLLPQPVNRWANIIVAVALFLFNVVSLGGYSPYDIFLLVISFGFNALTVWFAWKWI